MSIPAMSRRSFVQRKLELAGAHLTQAGDTLVAAAFGNAAAEAEGARSLGLADLSPLPRCGFKGPGTLEWLDAHGIQVRTDPNRAFAQPDGALVAMLSWSEALILDDPLGGNGPSARLAGAWSLDDASGCYALERRDSHYWFTVCGARAAEPLSKLCAVDLRPEMFAMGRIAQTTLARSNAIVIRADIGSTLAYYVLGDSASAEYVWDSLLDAMQEFDGQPAGIDALRRLKS
jgi:sarcosine oxidase subunit gamma